MRWLGVTAAIAGVLALLPTIDACSTCDCGIEGGAPVDATARVTNGEACSVEGAKAEGLTPKCASASQKYSQCVCSSGTWSCTCPPCGPYVVLGEACMPSGGICSGPAMAVLCDGTSVEIDTYCQCTTTSRWACKGVTNPSCVDAGADADSPDGGDAN